MTDINALLEQLASQETAFAGTRFVAPCVRGGRVRARVAGLVQTWQPASHDFIGWGLFQTQGGRIATLMEEADLPLVGDYLKLLMPLRLRLVHPLTDRTWLAYPANESDAHQRVGYARPIAVHLVTDGAPFESILARTDGSVWWFEDIDRRADPRDAERLRDTLRCVTPPVDVRFPGLTPEMRTAYDLAAQQAKEFFAQVQQRRDTERLQDALRLGGGTLRDFWDRGDLWLVEWTTRDGEHHTSAIAKNDLTVVNSGICLSDRDRDFDLQSLVGVIERRDTDWDY